MYVWMIFLPRKEMFCLASEDIANKNSTQIKSQEQIKQSLKSSMPTLVSVPLLIP